VPNVSRYRFVYPIERETTVEAIAACEAAWAFYGGVFRVMVIDNMKAVVARADRLEPKIMPREHFSHVEAPELLPGEPYDVPQWSTPKVARDHFGQVERALYSLPTRLIGRTLDARADRSLVRFYDRGRLVKVCEKLPPGGRHIDPEDYPQHKRAYAMRDIEYLQKTADELGRVGFWRAR
jgi:hypothetical protein